ncbi:hypothetical protein J8I87_00755 [Paraburkholderia sp. LEh10]|uniref:hypothetical protein n=1 Tax=Paraburkholderia sp. LEh10 TaxID=2821353 RepID=UPI001AE75DB8|nr:hypothetical protein [Paraburkholderia sp. LEh10]MBP0588273.1 hypothetical protein [Paraburkholderia sp. LEh10]
MTQFNVDLLLGRRVVSRDGKTVGRIETIQVIRDGDEWVISEFHIGPDALLERLAVVVLPRLLRDVLFHWRHSRSYRIAWHRIDLTDARNPRLVCEAHDLDT